ncbi:MAG: AbrB/MazE/SpoVT family DNA-binding domain-containing protein [Cyanobacteria bacterium J06648_16]
MTVKASLTESWQITIPPEVRHKLGIKAGDELVFIISGDEVRLRPIKRRRLSEFRGALPATCPYPGKQAVRNQVGKFLTNKASEST